MPLLRGLRFASAPEGVCEIIENSGGTISLLSGEIIAICDKKRVVEAVALLTAITVDIYDYYL